MSKSMETYSTMAAISIVLILIVGGIMLWMQGYSAGQRDYRREFQKRYDETYESLRRSEDMCKRAQADYEELQSLLVNDAVISQGMYLGELPIDVDEWRKKALDQQRKKVQSE